MKLTLWVNVMFSLVSLALFMQNVDILGELHIVYVESISEKDGTSRQHL